MPWYPAVILQARQRKREQKDLANSLANKELLAPLDPEKAYKASMVEIAAMEAPEGDFYVAHDTGFKKILVPLGGLPV